MVWGPLCPVFWVEINAVLWYNADRELGFSWGVYQMMRVVSCRVVDPGSPGGGDVQTALAPRAAEERFFRRRDVPIGRLAVRWRGCGGGFGTGSYNTADDVPTGLLFDVLA